MWYSRFLTPRNVIAAVGVVVLLFVFAPTFVAPKSGLLPPPSESAAVTPRDTTTTVDYSGVELPAVAGEIGPEPLVETGTSTIHGSVDVPDGRLPGATVRLERLVGDAVQRIDVVTAEDGTFTAANLPGGRYRVRAWLAPSYTVAEPEVFYLADGDDHELHLQAGELDGIVVRAATLPTTPYQGQGVNISVWVADRTVDADGTSREKPRPGVRVTLSVSGLSEVDPGAVRTTDSGGVAVFEFSCERAGAVSVTALVGASAPSPDPAPSDDEDTDDTTTTTTAAEQGDVDVIDEVVALDVPDCAPIPTTTTTTTTTTSEPSTTDTDE